MFGVEGGRKLFKRLPFIPAAAKPVIGMSLLGLLGLYVPYVLGRGYGTINLALTGQLRLPPRLNLPHEFTILLLLGLAAAKLPATALTSCSGGDPAAAT